MSSVTLAPFSARSNVSSSTAAINSVPASAAHTARPSFHPHPPSHAAPAPAHSASGLFTDTSTASTEEYSFAQGVVPPLRLPSGGVLPSLQNTASSSSAFTSTSHTRFYYKLVARVGPSRFFSIYDGTTEYVIGQTLRKPIQQSVRQSNAGQGAESGQAWTSRRILNENQGGLFVCRSAEEALECRIPDTAALYCAPRVLLKCLAWGDAITYGKSTVAFSNLRPVQVFPLSLGYINTRFGDKLVNTVKLAETRRKLPPFHDPRHRILQTFREREEMGVLTKQIMSLEKNINDITRNQLSFTAR